MRYKMIEECKKCKSDSVVKNGKQEGVQRYKCKKCGSVFRDSDRKYSPSFKMEVVMMYLNSIGLRAIARVKKIHNSLVSYWVKQVGTVVKEAFCSELEKVQSKDIKILEVDELFTYVKKKPIERIYLLMSTGTRVELLISKSAKVEG
jgi:transposase-like protein